jgi:hypothetical protein
MENETIENEEETYRGNPYLRMIDVDIDDIVILPSAEDLIGD